MDITALEIILTTVIRISERHAIRLQCLASSVEEFYYMPTLLYRQRSIVSTVFGQLKHASIKKRFKYKNNGYQ